VLGLIANVCYSVAYLIDLALQTASIRSVWRRWRWVLWLAGLILAIVLTNYWIADEIYPYVN
jgi:type II secretory pathway component PulL